MFNEKEWNLEKELIEKGSLVLKERINKIEELENRIVELEIAIKENNIRFRRHLNNLDAHKE